MKGMRSRFRRLSVVLVASCVPPASDAASAISIAPSWVVVSDSSTSSTFVRAPFVFAAAFIAPPFGFLPRRLGSASLTTDSAIVMTEATDPTDSLRLGALTRLETSLELSASIIEKASSSSISATADFPRPGALPVPLVLFFLPPAILSVSVSAMETRSSSSSEDCIGKISHPDFVSYKTYPSHTTYLLSRLLCHRIYLQIRFHLCRRCFLLLPGWSTSPCSRCLLLYCRTLPSNRPRLSFRFLLHLHVQYRPCVRLGVHVNVNVHLFPIRHIFVHWFFGFLPPASGRFGGWRYRDRCNGDGGGGGGEGGQVDEELARSLALAVLLAAMIV
ncbi:hypothetical protein BC938DRAFT_473862 [Jimgerdemannia flammicorona]|uniref:Uncharacterized protein n=1 Tax=Jimgerdemannia flammicorona TaxID=994334 RepID=A0A433Q3A2_9FUNG|nr:hypothetical protein BC938DRAFT_473862 [Jimgerdemannia flammicorona]